MDNIQDKNNFKYALEKDEILTGILESFSDPLYVIDVHDYSIVIANKAAKSRGVETENTCFALTHRINKPCWQNNEFCPLKVVLEKKESVTTEHIHYDKEGNPAYFEVRGYPIFDDKHDVRYMIEYSVNISERKKKEEELKNVLADLKLFKEATILRENKMIELKKEVNRTYKEMGKKEPFDLSFLE